MAVTSCPGEPHVRDDTRPHRGSFLTGGGGVCSPPVTSHIGHQCPARSQRRRERGRGGCYLHVAQEDAGAQGVRDLPGDTRLRRRTAAWPASGLQSWPSGTQPAQWQLRGLANSEHFLAAEKTARCPKHVTCVAAASAVRLQPGSAAVRVCSVSSTRRVHLCARSDSCRPVFCASVSARPTCVGAGATSLPLASWLRPSVPALECPVKSTPVPLPALCHPVPWPGLRAHSPM